MPYSIVAVVTHAGDRTHLGQSRVIDDIGTAQPYLTFDGTTKHKGIRTFADGRWSLVADGAANDLTYDISFFWTGLQAGDRFAFVTAATGQCHSAGLAADRQPAQPVR